MYKLKTLIFTVLVPGTVAGLLPWLIATQKIALASCETAVLHFVGWIFLGAGLVIYGFCAWDFAKNQGTPLPLDAPGFLVRGRLYKLTRNPMYVGVLSVIFGLAFLFTSMLLLVYAFLVFVLFHLFVVLYEEPALTHKFGASYAEYCSQVPRWLPDIRPGAKI